MYDNGLISRLPLELAYLEELRILALYWNELSGPIPSEIGNLSHLGWIDLGGNWLTGHLPGWLGDLGKLTYLSLWGNCLTGVPPGWPQNGRGRSSSSSRGFETACSLTSASPNSRQNFAVCAGSRVSVAFRNSSQTLHVLAHVAGCTERVRLATNSFNLPYRNAATTPERLATRDVLS